MIDFLLEQIGLRRISTIKPPPVIRGKTLDLKISEGANGRWRWFAYEGTTFLASGHPKGFISPDKAKTDAIDLFSRGSTFRDVSYRTRTDA